MSINFPLIAVVHEYERGFLASTVGRAAFRHALTVFLHEIQVLHDFPDVQWLLTLPDDLSEPNALLAWRLVQEIQLIYHEASHAVANHMLLNEPQILRVTFGEFVTEDGTHHGGVELDGELKADGAVIYAFFNAPDQFVPRLHFFAGGRPFGSEDMLSPGDKASISSLETYFEPAELPELEREMHALLTGHSDVWQSAMDALVLPLFELRAQGKQVIAGTDIHAFLGDFPRGMLAPSGNG